MVGLYFYSYGHTFLSHLSVRAYIKDEPVSNKHGSFYLLSPMNISPIYCSFPIFTKSIPAWIYYFGGSSYFFYESELISNESSPSA